MATTTCFLSSTLLGVVCSFSLNPKGKSFQRMTRYNPAPETAWSIQVDIDFSVGEGSVNRGEARIFRLREPPSGE